MEWLFCKSIFQQTGSPNLEDSELLTPGKLYKTIITKNTDSQYVFIIDNSNKLRQFPRYLFREPTLDELRNFTIENLLNK